MNLAWTFYVDTNPQFLISKWRWWDTYYLKDRRINMLKTCCPRVVLQTFRHALLPFSLFNSRIFYFSFLLNGRIKTGVLIRLGEFVIKVQTHEWRTRRKVLRANHHYKESKNISIFVQDNRYQNNAWNKWIPFCLACVLWQRTEVVKGW